MVRLSPRLAPAAPLLCSLLTASCEAQGSALVDLLMACPSPVFYGAFSQSGQKRTASAHPDEPVSKLAAVRFASDVRMSRWVGSWCWSSKRFCLSAWMLSGPTPRLLKHSRAADCDLHQIRRLRTSRARAARWSRRLRPRPRLRPRSPRRCSALASSASSAPRCDHASSCMQ